MFDLLAQTDPKTFWNAPNGSTELWVKIVLAALVGFGAIGICLAAPARFRKPIVGVVTFLSGLYYVLLTFYPAPINPDTTEAPRGILEGASFWLDDAQSIAAN